MYEIVRAGAVILTHTVQVAHHVLQGPNLKAGRVQVRSDSNTNARPRAQIYAINKITDPFIAYCAVLVRVVRCIRNRISYRYLLTGALCTLFTSQLQLEREHR